MFPRVYLQIADLDEYNLSRHGLIALVTRRFYILCDDVNLLLR